MNWEKVKLEDICQITGGTTPKTNRPEFWDGNIVWLSPVDLPEVGSITDVYCSQRKITNEGLASCSLRLLPVGSLVFSTRASIGKIGIVKTPLATNQGFTNFIPGERVNVRYLAYALKKSTKAIEKLGNSTTFNEVSRTAIKSFEIPLPPLPIQQQIADTLDKADALRRKDQELLDKYDELAQAVFYEMFGDPVKNEKNWKKSELGKIVKRIVVGHVGPTSDGYSTTGIPFLRTQNVRNGYINFSNLNYITHEFHRKLRKSILSEGDVLVSRVGVNRGMAAYVPKELDGANCANVVIIGKTSALNPCYLSFYLNATYGVSSDFGYSVGSAQGVVNTTMVKKWLTLIPPIQLQNEFEFRFNHILNQKKLTQKICNRSEDLHNLLTNTLFS